MNEPDKIPQIEFLKKEKVDIEFDVLTLSSLFSRREKLNHFLEKPHRVKFYHIFFITRGSGVHHIDFKPYNYSEGSLLFVSQGQVQTFEIKQDVEGVLLLFTEKFLQKNLIHSDLVTYYRLYNYHLHQPIMLIEETEKEGVGKLVGDIHTEYRRLNSFAQEESLRLYLKLLLLKLERIKRSHRLVKSNAQWFVKFGEFRKLLENHYTQTRNVKDYARMMSISAKHLNTICKSLSGYTTKSCIDIFVILEMKRHLATLDTSVKELTYSFGFDEPTNFVKYFKKHTGQSPAKFKAGFTQ